MTALAWLVPCALALGLLGLGAFMWSLKAGQLDDLEGAAWRALDEDQALEPSRRMSLSQDRKRAAPPPVTGEQVS